MPNCGICGPPGVHAYWTARGARPTAPCDGCRECKREQRRHSEAAGVAISPSDVRRAASPGASSSTPAAAMTSWSRR